MRPMRSSIWIALAVSWGLSGRAAADETVGLVLDAPGSTQGALLTRPLPAGVPVKVQLPVPGTDPTKGRLSVWPQPDGTCEREPSSGPQRHEIGMTASGTGDARVLEGVIPPLQLATSYCIVASFDRRIPDDSLAGLAEVVGKTPIVWHSVCQEADPTGEVAARVKVQIETQIKALGLDKAISSVRVAEAALTIARLLRVGDHCKKLGEADADLQAREQQYQAAADRHAAVKHGALCIPRKPGAPGLAVIGCTPPAATIAAWPAAVTRSGADYRVTTLAEALSSPALSDIAAALVAVSPAEMSELQGVAGLAPGGRAAKQAALKLKLSQPPAVRLPLALFVPARGGYVPVSELYATDANHAPTDEAGRVYGELIHGLRDSRSIVIGQLQLQRQQDRATAQGWIDHLSALADAIAGQIAAKAVVEEAEKALAALEASVSAELVRIVKLPVVADLLRQTASVPVRQMTGAAPLSDEKGSWISPTIGVLAAAPIVVARSRREIAEGWLAPYAGASIYFCRVDRVIDLNDLVDAKRCRKFWQRFSFTVGLLLARPDVHGKDVNGPWDVGVVPFLGFGRRMTQYIRLDVGAIPFKHVDLNPAVSDTHWGVALWFGASIDFDVWALVAGKLVK